LAEVEGGEAGELAEGFHAGVGDGGAAEVELGDLVFEGEEDFEFGVVAAGDAGEEVGAEEGRVGLEDEDLGTGGFGFGDDVVFGGGDALGEGGVKGFVVANAGGFFGVGVGGFAFGVAFPAAEVSAGVDPGFEQGFFGIGEGVAFGGHEHVIVFGEGGDFVEVAAGAVFGFEDGAVFAAFHDGPGAVEAEAGFGFFFATVDDLGGAVAVDAFFAEDGPDFLFELGGSGKRGDL
jgi:hypothetical protein